MSDRPTPEEAALQTHRESSYPLHVRAAFAALMALTADERSAIEEYRREAEASRDVRMAVLYGLEPVEGEVSALIWPAELPCSKCRRRHEFRCAGSGDFQISLVGEPCNHVIDVGEILGYIRRLETHTTEWWEGDR